MIEGLLDRDQGDKPAPIEAAEDVTREHLRPGVRVMRYTQLISSAPEERCFFCLVPCCGRKARLTYRYGRGHVWALVLCTFCEPPYAAEAWPDADGGSWVCLTVDDVPFVTTSLR